MSATSGSQLHSTLWGDRAIGARMALLPDLAAAALYGVAVFLVVLGFLVVFVETVSPRRLAAGVMGAGLVASGLASIGEPGMALLAVGVGAALVANHSFEWLTTR